MRKGISMELSERLAREKGFLPAPRDHPIYSEGVTITFLRREPRRAAPKRAGSERTQEKSRG